MNDGEQNAGKDEKEKVTFTVNNKTVTLPKKKATGLEIKQAAIAQGVEIQEDFLLTLEAHDGEPAQTIADDREIKVEDGFEFTANDGDDDS
jgi:hypothetical protein